jgi:hypothetical protein
MHGTSTEKRERRIPQPHRCCDHGESPHWPHRYPPKGNTAAGSAYCAITSRRVCAVFFPVFIRTSHTERFQGSGTFQRTFTVMMSSLLKNVALASLIGSALGEMIRESYLLQCHMHLTANRNLTYTHHHSYPLHDFQSSLRYPINPITLVH